MTSILLAPINARHSHTAFGARYLLANMGDLRAQTALVEFTIQQPAEEIAQRIVAHSPRILGLSAYIWNAERLRQLLSLLRRRLPDTRVVLGGPELTPGADWDADVLLLGEGDLAFAATCRRLLDAPPPAERLIHAPPPELEALALPYGEYTDEDLAHRTLYVETSRGCAMRCDYCVSATGEAVRYFPLDTLLPAFDTLLERGARLFKFCDRSFNLHLPRAVAILRFFRERLEAHPGLFLHVEMLPERFTPELLAQLAAFPPRSLQLEIGLQSFDEDVLSRIRRPQNVKRAEDILRHLRQHTAAYLHTDLIAGLPGETPASFASGFDRLAALRPHEIQLGILKKLPGAPIVRHQQAFDMRFNPRAPYEIRSTKDWPADHLRRTERFAHYWDAIVNSGRFLPAAPLLWAQEASVFEAFMAFSDWMGRRFFVEHGIPLADKVSAVFDYLTRVRAQPPAVAADALLRGYRHTGARDIPPALAPHLPAELPPPSPPLPRALRRQHLHWTYDA
ncbi:MAG: DUF4080 domain-containing protein [Verrucomicrobiota bacterium]|jgi:hypothetical protein|nr:DUF4080 domain-containing protein [Verrucomicrobiota bacterium]